MKQAFRLLSLMLALLLALSPCALGEETAQPAAAEDPVLFTLDGKAYAKSEVDLYVNDLLSYGYLESASDYDTAIQFIVENKVIDDKIKELGLDQFTEDEKAAFRAEAQKEWDEMINSYVSYYLTEDTDEARSELRQAAEAYYSQVMGVTLEDVVKNFMSQDSYDRLLEGIFAQKGSPATDADIQTAFNEAVAQQKEIYDSNINMYELYKYYGQEIWYQPAGYRGVLHILLGADEALLNAYQDAQNAYEESKSAEEGASDPAALQAAVEDARQAILNSEKAAIDDIYARLQKGESFESLMALYNEDDGMKDENILKTGYEIHKDSMLLGWDTAFIAGAFQEKMQHPGDVSDPVVSSFGVHIIYYLRDVPAGPVELTDAIRAEIRENLENISKNTLFYQELETWEKAHDLQMNTEEIEKAKAAAQPANTAEGDSADSLSEEEMQELLNQLAQSLEEAPAEETPETEPAPAE